MGRFVSSFTAIAAASGDPVPYRDLIVFAAALLAVMCLAGAAAVWVAARREGWSVRVRLED